MRNQMDRRRTPSAVDKSQFRRPAARIAGHLMGPLGLEFTVLEVATVMLWS